MYKLNCCVAVAGASVPLILAGSASGEVIGLVPVFKPVDPADIAADTNIPGITSLLVVNVYATFTPGDAAWIFHLDGSVVFHAYMLFAVQLHGKGDLSQSLGKQPTCPSTSKQEREEHENTS